MKCLYLLFSCFSLNAATVIIPITTGYDFNSGQAAFSDGTLDKNAATDLIGYMYPSNTTGSTYWYIPRQFFVSSLTNGLITNMVVNVNLLTTNGTDRALGNGYAFYFRMLLYTNFTSTNAGVVIGSPTNALTPYYDSGNLTVSGTARNGTNITILGYTNTISDTNLFSYRTNIAFGIVKITHNVVSGSWGSQWLLNGRFQTR